jgi:hypothetical protein
MLQVDRQWLRSDKSGARGPAASHAVNHRRKFLLPTRTDLQNRNNTEPPFRLHRQKKGEALWPSPFCPVTPLVLSLPATTAAT